jgi:hypothetical protein
MDIDDVVRRARPGSSQGWARSAQGRQVLAAVTAAAPRESRERRAPRWSFIGTGLVGTAAAAVLVTSLVVSTGADPKPDVAPRAGAVPGASASTNGGATPVTARDILLAAATRAEQAPAETGKYWHVKTLSVFGPQPVGTGPDEYLLLRRSITESWDAREPGQASWTGERTLGVRPRSEADQKAWKAAGSPTEWTLDSDGGRDIVLSTEPGRGELRKDTEPPRYLEDIGQFSLAQVRQLPADRQALREWVTSRIKREMGYAPGSADGDQLLFGFLSRLLLDTPAPPAVRASAFRILADLPGARGLGEVRDESGRSGQGIEFTGGGGVRRLIIDDDTHLLLAVKTSASPDGAKVPIKENSTLVLAAEWSDAAPAVPSVPKE